MNGRDYYICTACRATVTVISIQYDGLCPKCGGREFMQPYEGWKPSFFARCGVVIRERWIVWKNERARK